MKNILKLLAVLAVVVSTPAFSGAIQDLDQNPPEVSPYADKNIEKKIPRGIIPFAQMGGDIECATAYAYRNDIVRASKAMENFKDLSGKFVPEEDRQDVRRAAVQAVMESLNALKTHTVPPSMKEEFGSAEAYKAMNDLTYMKMCIPAWGKAVPSLPLKK